MANYELLSFANADKLAQAAASAWLGEIEAAGRDGKPYCTALSGGRITQKFFAETVAQARAQRISFAHMHFFWADERCVPPDDPESNFKLASELLFAPLNIPGPQIHRLQGEIAPAEAVRIAEKELRETAAKNSSGQPVLDLILLGMGEDGHVASLFPHSMSQIQDTNVSFLAIDDSPKPPPRRISLSYAAIITAKNVWTLASGAGKAAALHDSLSSFDKTPLGRVIRLRHHTKVFSDIGETT